MNLAADAWASAQATASEILDGLEVGDYVERWEDLDEGAEPIGEQVCDELRALARRRGLRLETDDTGLRLVRAEED